MNTPTYQQQFDKLTAAYVNNKVIPMDSCACFVGNLLNGNGEWHHVRHGYGELTPRKDALQMGTEIIVKESNGFYTPLEIVLLEEEFMKGSGDLTYMDCPEDIDEDLLFKAFCNTLEALKKIHIEKGEVIDTPQVFQKRKLQSV